MYRQKLKHIFGAVLAAAAVFVFCVSASAEVEAPELKFVPAEGRYIYCNNREFITREDLADVSNEKASFIMTNEDLTADKYALFVSHVNHTDKRNEDGTQILEEGFDVEVDVLFRAEEDTKIRITALGFEVPENTKYYLDGNIYTNENQWGCFNAWADYLNMPISEIDSGVKYDPIGFEPVEFEVKAGEDVWLSKYIENYREVPYYRPVHIVADFEILSGKTDVNVCAVKATGTLGDRSHLARNLRHGAYIYEHQHKGIADTLNQMDAELNYTIDDSVASGEALPIKIFNQYVPEGNVAWMWVTHINPRSDYWSKQNGDETGMIKLEYEDDSKLMYYGKDVPEEERDNIWRFDTTHTDVPVYPGEDTGYTKNTYVPNYEIKESDKDEYACSLGNFGVFVNYHINVTNNGNTDRWFNYKLNTTSSNLIILRDENGNVMEPYPICKGYHEKKEEDILASIELPAGETTSFTLTVVLTTNYLGGMENNFIITDHSNPVKTYEPSWTDMTPDTSYTGKEYIKWENGELYTSLDKTNWVRRSLNEQTKKIFDGHWNEFKLLWTGNGYIAKNTLYDGIPYYIVRDFFQNVYFLDSSFNLTSTYSFGAYPTDMAVGTDGIYVKAGTRYYSTDGQNWEKASYEYDLPVYNYGRFAVYTKNGEVFISPDDTNMYKVDSDIISAPVYTDGVYYISSDNLLYSYDGVYWADDTEKLTQNAPVIILDNTTALSLSVPPSQDGTVPLRSFSDYMRWDIGYSDGCVTIETGTDTVKIQENSQTAELNGDQITLSTAMSVIDGISSMNINDIKTLFGLDLKII